MENKLNDSVGPFQAPDASAVMWGRIALALSVCSILVPLLLAYVLFPAALVATIVAYSKKARIVLPVVLLVLAGSVLLLSAWKYNKAVDEFHKATRQFQGAMHSRPR